VLSNYATMAQLSSEFCTASDYFKVVHIQKRVLPLWLCDPTMINAAVSSVQHRITLKQPILKTILLTLSMESNACMNHAEQLNAEGQHFERSKDQDLSSHLDSS
jgi:hypothetical protein